MAREALQEHSALDFLEPLLVGVLFIGVCVAGYFFLIEPQFKKFLPGGSLHEETLQQEITDRKNYLTRLEGLQKEYQDAQTKTVTTLSAALPEGRDTPSLFALYEAIAKENGIVLQSIDITGNDNLSQRNIQAVAQEQQSGLREVHTALKLGGVQYSSLKTFLASVEKNLRITDVESVSFDPKTHFVNVSLINYYQPGKE